MDLGYVCALQRSARKHSRQLYLAFGKESDHFCGIQPVLDATVAPKSSEGRQLWAGKQELRSTLCLWLSCSGLSAQDSDDMILRARAFQPVVRATVSLLKDCGVFWGPWKTDFSAVSPTPQCFSQMLFASKLPGFEIQVRCWMKKYPSLHCSDL